VTTTIGQGGAAVLVDRLRAPREANFGFDARRRGNFSRRRMENAWLSAVASELERETAVSLAVTRDEIDELLRLAAFAAHESGVKLNAPLLCFMVGRAAEASGRSIAELAATARGVSFETTR
jgi:hypothetical protein